ncbi:MAG: hypothetical protein AAF828_10430 [Bacteroidota bacterium]
MRTHYYSLLVLLCLMMMGCPQEDDDQPIIEPPPPPPPTEPAVNFDLANVPYAKLSDYNFFTGDDLAAMTPNEGLLLYQPISTLFSDYAKKLRYVWLPDGTKTSYAADHEVLDFPNGSVIIKTFYYDNVLPDNERRIIETRLLYRKDDVWYFADYTWNDAQTEADFDLSGSNTQVVFDDNGTQRTIDYRIPSESECLTCHKKFDQATPLGPKPQNLNAVLDYADGNPMNQLVKWKSVDYLEDNFNPADVNTTVDWHDTNLDLTLRVRSYLDMNCSSCHRAGGHCDYRPIRLAFAETDVPGNLGICVPPDEFVAPGQVNIITPGNEEKSALFYRMNSNQVMVRMPLLGRSVIHEEAISMMEEWINNLTENCD